jgi:hypothetical protein
MLPIVETVMDEVEFAVIVVTLPEKPPFSAIASRSVPARLLVAVHA